MKCNCVVLNTCVKKVKLVFYFHSCSKVVELFASRFFVSSRGRVVKALDLKSNGVSPRRFEPCRLRIFFQQKLFFQYSILVYQIINILDSSLLILRFFYINKNCLLWGLNPRPPVYETGALPLS